MDLGPHTGARLGTIGISNSFDFYIPITPYPLRGKGGSKGNFWPSWRVRDCQGALAAVVSVSHAHAGVFTHSIDGTKTQKYPTKHPKYTGSS